MKILLCANTDWYLYNFRLPLARKLRENGFEVVLVSPPGEYGPRLEAEGFRWINFPFSRKGLNPLIELFTIWRLTRLYRKEKPDLVHHFTIKCVLYGSRAAQKARIPAVVNAITGLGYVFVKQTFPVRVIRWIVKRFYHIALKNTQVIFQNPDDRQMFLDLNLVQTQNSHLIRGSGIDVTHFVPLAEPDCIPLVVLPGRMIWDKGVGDFVEAARILKDRGVRARFALVGKSDPQNPSGISLEQLGQWQKEGHVEWWGFQEDMTAVFAQANIICLPSYREGMPRVLTEAAASQRALITTDVPGCRGAVYHGKNGLLVPPRDPSALADALQTLIESPDLRKKMGEAGREIAVNEFSDEIVIDQTIQIYQKFRSISE